MAANSALTLAVAEAVVAQRRCGLGLEAGLIRPYLPSLAAVGAALFRVAAGRDHQAAAAKQLMRPGQSLQAAGVHRLRGAPLAKVGGAVGFSQRLVADFQDQVVMVVSIVPKVALSLAVLDGLLVARHSEA